MKNQIYNKIYKSISLIVAVLLFAGCSFLEVEKPGKNDIPKFFSNMEGLRFARNGMYKELYTFCDNYYTKYAEVAADMVEVNQGDDMREQFNYESKFDIRGTAVGYIWEQGYSCLANTNNIIKYAPQIKESLPHNSAEIDKIYAEALFVRALCHLMLCNVYAQPYNYTSDASHLGIPIMTRLAGSNEETPRSKVSDVYKLITDDLADALGILGEPTAPNKDKESTDWSYYATSRACKALQARVYLYMGNNGLARDCATALINVMPLTPYADYEKMIQLQYDAEPGVESIFRLSGLGQSSHRLASFYFDDSSGAPAVASSKLLETFVYDDDVRKELIDGRQILKYRNPVMVPPSDGSTSTVPETSKIPYGVPVLRLSEIYLIRAEAYCKLNEPALAADDLKAIIGRAINKDPQDVTLSYSSADDLLGIVERERCLELFGEGHRLFDIIRNKKDMVRDSGNASPVKTVTYPNNRFVLPIPNDEISVNHAIEQNPGY